MTSDEISLNNRNTGWSESSFDQRFTYIYSKHQTILFIRLTKDSCTDVAISHSFSVQKMSEWDEKNIYERATLLQVDKYFIVHCHLKVRVIGLSEESKEKYYEWFQRKIYMIECGFCLL